MPFAPFRVLLIEDNPGDAALLAASLDTAAPGTYRLSTVARLEQANRALVNEDYDLILLDLRLPDSTGLASFHRVRELAGDTPVVIVSGVEDEATALAAVQAGAQDYLVKGTLEPIALARTLRHTLERARLEDERRKLDARVQHARRLEGLSALAGGVANDFNNLLTTILGHSDLTLGLVPPSSPAWPHVERVEAAALRAADLARQLLGFAGRGRFNLRAHDLGEIIGEAAQLLETLLPEDVDLRMELAEGLPPVEVDARQVRQVVVDLVSNAADAMGDQPGHIVVRTGKTRADRAYLSETYLDEDLPEGDYLYLEVQDHGEGIEQAELSKVFDPFYSTRIAGRGLGLATVLGVVRGHRGAIKVQSVRGEGSTFRVLFPAGPRARTETPAAAAPARPGPKAVEGEGATGVILVVEDEESVREVTDLVLRDAGFEVVLARDGREGVATFREHGGAFDVVLLDLTMPGMNGEEVFRALRAERPDLRVVLTSGYDESVVTARFAGLGLTGFLQKPYLPAALVQAVTDALPAEA